MRLKNTTENDLTPRVMSPEEEAYRKELRDVLLEVSSEFLKQHQTTLVGQAIEILELRKKLRGEP